MECVDWIGRDPHHVRSAGTVGAAGPDESALRHCGVEAVGQMHEQMATPVLGPSIVAPRGSGRVNATITARLMLSQRFAGPSKGFGGCGELCGENKVGQCLSTCTASSAESPQKYEGW